MTKILDRLPVSKERTSPQFGERYITIRPNQILIWVGIDRPETQQPADDLPKFPALLDTGNNFEFSIQYRHLKDWARIDTEYLPRRGHISYSGQKIPRHEAVVWIYRKLPGQRDIDIEKPPYRIKAKQGIAVYPEEASTVSPRLPLLGLPALLNNNLDLWIDADRRQVNVYTRSWAKGIIRFLMRIST